MVPFGVRIMAEYKVTIPYYISRVLTKGIHFYGEKVPRSYFRWP